MYTMQTFLFRPKQKIDSKQSASLLVEKCLTIIPAVFASADIIDINLLNVWQIIAGFSVEFVWFLI